MFERRRAMAEEKLIAAGGSSSTAPEDGGGDGDGAAAYAADPVSAAVVKSLDAKLESIDDLIARLEIEEGEVRMRANAAVFARIASCGVRSMLLSKCLCVGVVVPRTCIRST